MQKKTIYRVVGIFIENFFKIFNEMEFFRLNFFYVDCVTGIANENRCWR